MKMLLGTEVGLGSGHIVFDGYISPTEKHSSPSIFSPCLLWPNGSIDQDVTWSEIGIGPGDIVSDGDPAPATERGIAAPTFRPMSIVAEPLDGSRCHLVWR